MRSPCSLARDARFSELWNSKTSVSRDSERRIISSEGQQRYTRPANCPTDRPTLLSLCLCIPLSLLGNGMVKIFLQLRIHTQIYKSCWRRCFAWGTSIRYPIRSKKKVGYLLLTRLIVILRILLKGCELNGHNNAQNVQCKSEYKPPHFQWENQNSFWQNSLRDLALKVAIKQK
jgi:hypothetical protein